MQVYALIRIDTVADAEDHEFESLLGIYSSVPNADKGREDHKKGIMSLDGHLTDDWDEEYPDIEFRIEPFTLDLLKG